MMNNDKPAGAWKCRTCGVIWHGSSTYRALASVVTFWTCGNEMCGGAVYDITTTEEGQEFLNNMHRCGGGEDSVKDNVN